MWIKLAQYKTKSSATLTIFLVIYFVERSKTNSRSESEVFKEVNFGFLN
jgi:hypothetical protein